MISEPTSSRATDMPRRLPTDARGVATETATKAAASYDTKF